VTKEANPFDNPDLPCPLTEDQISTLATFNSEKARGLVHFPGYAFEMAKLQSAYDKWTRACLEAYGEVTEVDGGLLVMPHSVRISSKSPHVTGGASVSPEELDAVSEEIKHTHLFDRLHGFCRCGSTEESA